MRKFILALGLATLLLAGCVSTPITPSGDSSPLVSANSTNDINPPEYIIPVAIPISDAVDMPIDPQTPLRCAIVPAYYELTMFSGAIADTWVTEGHCNIGKVALLYDKNSPLCLFIYNGKSNPTIFSVSYEDAPELINHCSATGEDYSIAPVGASQWLTISNSSPTVNAGCVKAIPFKIEIPEDADCPKQWEFRIRVKDITQTDFVQTAMSIRVLITMQ